MTVNQFTAFSVRENLFIIFSFMQDEQTSYPRSKIKILLLENISDAAVAELSAGGYTEIKRVSGAISEDDLIEAIKGVHILGIRSKTQVTEKVLEAADKLLAIGAFCIGTNQINLKAAMKNGVAVFNAPYSNTRSVAELIIGLCVMLIRKISDKNAAAHRGIWMKDAKGSFELRGKTLGIIGYGNIGSQVSVMAEALGLNVIYYDVITKLPHGNAKQIRDLNELLAQSDIVTLHIPSDATTRRMIDENTFKDIKQGAIFLNYSRGDVVDLEALKAAIENGTISGAAVDVFPARAGKKRRRIFERTAKSAERHPNAAHRRLDRRSAGKYRLGRDGKASQLSRTRRVKRFADRAGSLPAVAGQNAPHSAHPRKHSRRALGDQLAPVRAGHQHSRSISQNQRRDRLCHSRCQHQTLAKGVRNSAGRQRHDQNADGLLRKFYAKMKPYEY